MEHPEMIDTAQKLDTARAELEEAQRALSAHTDAARRARALLAEIRARVNNEARALTDAKAAHARALLANDATREHAETIRHLETNLGSLTELLEKQSAEADRLDAEIMKHGSVVQRAEMEVARAHKNDLIARYLKLIAPAIPLAREIHARAQQWNIQLGGFNSHGSGLLLNLASPTVGRFTVNEAGEISFT